MASCISSELIIKWDISQLSYIYVIAINMGYTISMANSDKNSIYCNTVRLE